MISLDLPAGQALYFASDFHLGAPNAQVSRERERALVRWLDQIKGNCAHLYLLGDIFDFWFEYRHTVPKGFLRLQGKLAEFSDAGIPITMFHGNHDMWMRGYFEDELGATIVKDNLTLEINGKKLLIGHGDGLGPGDRFYKFLRTVLFRNPFCRWLFARIHPNFGMGLALFWSRGSRKATAKRDAEFLGEEKEWILQYCKEVEAKTHHDYYVFGHRHLPLDLPVGPDSRYINLGEWLHSNTYGVFSGTQFVLRSFETSEPS